MHFYYVNFNMFDCGLNLTYESHVDLGQWKDLRQVTCASPRTYSNISKGWILTVNFIKIGNLIGVTKCSKPLTTGGSLRSSSVTSRLQRSAYRALRLAHFTSLRNSL